MGEGGAYVLAPTFRANGALLRASCFSPLSFHLLGNQAWVRLGIGERARRRLCPLPWFSGVARMRNRSKPQADPVVSVDPGLLGELGKGKEAPEKSCVGGRPFQIQKMTGKLLWVSRWGSRGEASNLSSAVSLTLRGTLAGIKTQHHQTPRPPNGNSYCIGCQGRVVFQTLKHYSQGKKKKEWGPGEERKMGSWKEEEMTRFMKLEVF